MSDTVHVAAPSIGPDNLIEHMGFKGAESLPMDITKQIIEMSQLLHDQGLDPETSLGLLKSFELKNGQAEEPTIRIKKFLEFIKSHSTKEGLLNSVKSIGFFSKRELEDYAKDTGDWVPFLRRISA